MKQSLPESTKVRSLLTLAGGAAALPLAVSPADAAIIVDSTLSGTVIGWNTGAGQTPSVIRTLPGTGGFQIGTRANAVGGNSAFGYVGVAIGVVGGVPINFRLGGPGLYQALLAPFGATVNAGNPAYYFMNVNLGRANGGANVGNSAFSGSSKYLLFSFLNSGTSDMNYGWIELTAATTGFNGNGASQYSATLGKWAYDNSGAAITAGQTAAIPEPSTLSLLAMVTGAVALRRSRKQTINTPDA